MIKAAVPPKEVVFPSQPRKAGFLPSIKPIKKEVLKDLPLMLRVSKL
jgi:hypothetical protein